MTVFHLTSNQLRVTDPCYTKGTWCAGVLENVLPGAWIAEKVVASHEQTGWGDRIAELCIWHGDFIGNVDAHELTEIHVGVDSGQAGFFDETQYPEGETGEYMNLDTFYGKVCSGTAGDERIWEEPLYTEDMIERLEKIYTESKELSNERVRDIIDSMRTATRVRSEPNYLGIANVGFGVATHSGYGDGGYNCYVGRNDKGEIVAARIVFIGDEEDEDDE
jgi:hypothetical protein